MKKFNRFFIRSLILIVISFFGFAVQGQIIFTSTPDTTATLNETYNYDVNVTANPPEVTFSLVEKPAGMVINGSTGVIDWTPTNINQGGKVIVKATNTAGDYTQQFYVFVTNAIECPDLLNSYWDMDNVNGDTTIFYDNANSYDAQYGGGDVKPGLVTGKVGTAIQLEPQGVANTFLQVADEDQYEWMYDNDFSISLWFKNKPTGIPSQTEVFIGRVYESGSWWFGWNNTTRFVEALLVDGSGDTAVAYKDVAVNDTLWHHAVLVYEGSNAGTDYIRIYLDKAVKTTYKSFNTGRFDGTGIVTIGYWDRFGTNKYPFSGCLDEMAIFDRALSADDVTQLFNRAAAGNPLCQAGNYAPLFTTTPVTAVNEDSPYVYTVEARDYENQSLTYGATVLPSWLNFNTDSRLLSGTPDNDNVGDTTVTILVSDGVDTVDQSFTITVANVNDLPEFTSTALTSIDEDSAYSYTVTAIDVDEGSSITLSAPVLPGWLSFDPVTGLLSGTPTNEQVGTSASTDHNVTIRATDNTSASTDQAFVITVLNINDAPEITAKASLSTDEDTPVEITLAHLTVTDVDDVYPDDFTLTVKDGDDYTFTGNNVTPAQDYFGTLSVNFDLSDGSATISDVYTVTVNAVNDLPVFTSTPKTTILEGTLYTYVVSATDVDLDELTYSAVKNPLWLSFDPGERVFAGTPGNTDVGTDSVVVEVNDGTSSVYQKFTVTVDPASGIWDNTGSNALISAIYPIPATDMLYLKLNNTASGNIEIIDFTGKVVKSGITFASDTQITLNLSALKAGVYFCRITANEETQVIKFIKE
ncbi:MAG: T9SS type A sorting domain-containing protein [Bacteroidales bacterium]|nr:T9SS type A sorting domain-containing protein [Bacteroidales bacterium]MBN2764000.1 T9SS type A sorting domain-containing protein [Bacteroidales bacterium]